MKFINRERERVFTNTMLGSKYSSAGERGGVRTHIKFFDKFSGSAHEHDFYNPSVLMHMKFQFHF